MSDRPDDHPTVADFDLSKILACLADENRRSVIETLYHQPDGLEQFCSVFGLPWAASTRTHHFRLLRRAGLIHQRDVGNGQMTQLRRLDLEEAYPGLLKVLFGPRRVQNKKTVA